MEKIDNSLLEKLNIQKVESLEVLFNSLINLNDLDENLMPKIVTEKTTLVIFDNEDYNETYLIDLVKNYLENNKISDKIEIKYIDNLDIRLKIFAPKIQMQLFDNKNNPTKRKEIEKANAIPAFMLILPKTNSIEIVKESFISVLNAEDVKNCFKILMSQL